MIAAFVRFGNRMTPWNPKWRRAENLKTKTGDNKIQFLEVLKLSFKIKQ